MSTERSLVETEIEEHIAYLQEWTVSLHGQTIPTSQKGVVERFIRDCNTLQEDLNNGNPLSADLVDFNDRRCSLEIQYHHILSDIA